MKKKAFAESPVETRFLPNKVKDFLLFIINVSLLCFSIRFGASQVSRFELLRISRSFVEKILLATIIFTAFAIHIQSWLCSKHSRTFEENMRKFNKVFGHSVRSRVQQASIWRKAFEIFSFFIENFALLLICLTLSIIPLFCDKVYSIWEILLFSILVIKVTTFRYAAAALRIRDKIVEIKYLIEHIMEEHESLEDLNLPSGKFKTSDFDKKRVVKMIKSFNVVSSMVDSFNSRFGFSILCIIFTAFLSITYCGYHFFIEIETRKNKFVLIENASLFVSFLLVIVMAATACQKCINEGQLLGALLHSIDDFDENEIVKKFSMQLIQQEVKFKAAGFFNVGSPILASVLASFMTYEIILIQFYFDT